MRPETVLVGLDIASPFVTPQSANFLPPRWPPPQDFPIVINAKGVVVSRYGDSIWNLSPWAGKAMRLNFGDGKLPRGVRGITKVNSALFRQIVAWWLYGTNSVRTAKTLSHRFGLLRPLFTACSQDPKPIAAADLMRYPEFAERIARELQKSQTAYALTLLHDLFEIREFLGFTLFDTSGLKRLAAAFPDHEAAQTPYIPPRIWLYQMSRLRVFLDDFLDHRRQIEDCFRFCLDAYANNAGSLEKACSQKIYAELAPFKRETRMCRTRPSMKFYGRFSNTAERFGIKALLERWTIQPGETLDSSEIGVQALSVYFTLVGYVGTAYLMNLSMMRIDEAWSLRADCLTIERDELGEDIYILKGPTTKTVADDDARWITSPSAKVAVEAMVAATNLRMLTSAAYLRAAITPEEIRNPHLVERPFEPWNTRSRRDVQTPSIRVNAATYEKLASSRVFDREELRITAADLETARLITPTLNPARFEVGKVWPLAWHQLRRTGAVNMNASGIVGDASIQYQLKHATRAMSRYYGQGYYHLQLRLNESARIEYVRTMYEVIARDFSLLGSDRFVSPYGEQRKAQILNTVSSKDNKTLVAAAKSGRIAYKEHLLGGCTNPDPCPFGGIDSIAPCGGDGKACEHLLYDRKKIPLYLRLQKVIALRLVEAPEESPLRASLQRQKQTIESALDACEST
jgi:hypothetical protein